jgi:hypothetical protein
MGGPFNLGALAPMLDEGSRLLRFLTKRQRVQHLGVLVNAIGTGGAVQAQDHRHLHRAPGVYLGFAYLGSMFQG